MFSHSHFPQLLYAGSWVYASDPWCELITLKERFMCEKVILQYIGFVKTHMRMVEKGNHAGTAREGKFLYQVHNYGSFVGCIFLFYVLRLLKQRGNIKCDV